MYGFFENGREFHQHQAYLLTISTFKIMPKRKKNSALSAIGIGLFIVIVGFIFQEQIKDIFFKNPDLAVKSLETIRQSWTNYNFGFRVGVVNDGDRTAIDCHVNLNGDVTNETKKARSPVFGLAPGEQVDIEVHGIIYEKPGDYIIEANVDCSNHSPTDSLKRKLIVDEP